MASRRWLVLFSFFFGSKNLLALQKCLQEGIHSDFMPFVKKNTENPLLHKKIIFLPLCFFRTAKAGISHFHSIPIKVHAAYPFFPGDANLTCKIVWMKIKKKIEVTLSSLSSNMFSAYPIPTFCSIMNIISNSYKVGSINSLAPLPIHQMSTFFSF